MDSIVIDEAVAKHVLETVDAGLVSGLGSPTPGKMCVEAAVCYALGLPHSDDPQCVDQKLRLLKIELNDSRWSNNQERAKGLRRLSVVQLGSIDNLGDEFAKQVYNLVITKYLRKAFETCSQNESDEKLKLEYEKYISQIDLNEFDIYKFQEKVDNDDFSYANSDKYRFLANVGYKICDYMDEPGGYIRNVLYRYSNLINIHLDTVLAEFCEDVVQILIKLNVPGAKWLYLTESE